MTSAADITIYTKTSVDRDYVCDIGWVGGYWGYKAKNLDKYLMPVVKKYGATIIALAQGDAGTPKDVEQRSYKA